MFDALVQHGSFSAETVKDPALAAQSYERALLLARKRAAAEPQNFSASNELATLLSMTGEYSAMQGNEKKALDRSREAIQLSETLLTSAPEAQPRKLLAQSFSSLAFCQNMLKQSGEAITSGRRALESRSGKRLGQDQPGHGLRAYWPISAGGTYSCRNQRFEIRKANAAAIWWWNCLTISKKRGIDHPDAGKVRELVRATGDR